MSTAFTQVEMGSTKSWLRARLRCPVTGEELIDAVGLKGQPVLLSRGAQLAYPVRDGVPILLEHEALVLGEGGRA